MLLPELITSVYTETNRPDLVAQTLQAIRASTLKLHTIDLFPKDIKEGQVVFDQLAYIQNIPTINIPRYRRTVHVRKYDPRYAAYQQNPTLDPPLLNGLPPLGYTYGPNERLKFLRQISPDNILDEYGVEKLDVWYQAGSQLWIKSATALQYALLGWYEFPNIDATTPDSGLTYPNYSSWVANERPYAIIYDAASAILQKIGMTDAARKYDSPASGTSDGGLVQNEIKRLIADNIVDDTLLGPGMGDDF